ncbi:MAG: hypothetical protein HC923_03820 [Myxococcales bacterium]|nr:hypothetical protein [Myxococcales bacterium]
MMSKTISRIALFSVSLTWRKTISIWSPPRRARTSLAGTSCSASWSAETPSRAPRNACICAGRSSVETSPPKKLFTSFETSTSTGRTTASHFSSA